MIRLLNNSSFMISRIVIYMSLPLFYLYLLYINTNSCVNQTCILCGMKTAIWEMIHFHFTKAFEINPFSRFIVILSAIIIIDIIQMSIYTICYIRPKKSSR